MEGEEELIYFWVGRADTEAGGSEPISPDELDQYEIDVGMDGLDNAIFTDGDSETPNGVHVWDSFIKNNSDLSFGNGIPVVFKKSMTIGAIAGTYDWETYPLEDIQAYLQE